GAQQKRCLLKADRRGASRVSATQPQMPQNAPTACPHTCLNSRVRRRLEKVARVFSRPSAECLVRLEAGWSHPRTPPHLETRALTSGHSGKPSGDIGDNRAESVLL